MINHEGTVFLETARCILRKFKETDIEDMFNNWSCDNEVTKYLTWNNHKTIKSTAIVVNMWINSYKKRDYYNWAIEDKKTGKVIGSINLAYIDNYNENCEVGYCLSHLYWNRGIMTEVLSAIIEFSFEVLNFERITARHALGNTASKRVIEKCGFIYEGTLRKIIKNADGILIDCRCYSILKEDFLKNNYSFNADDSLTF